MKYLKRAILLAIVVLYCSGCEILRSPSVPSNPPIVSTPEPSPIPKASISIADVILETNNQRRANGLSPLTENSKLNEAADFKMRDMFARQYFDHFAPDGTSGAAELLIRFNYSYIVAGENLAWGDFRSASELVGAWMASPGHRANILNSIYRDIGVGVGFDVFMGRNATVAVQIFGTSR